MKLVRHRSSGSHSGLLELAPSHKQRVTAVSGRQILSCIADLGPLLDLPQISSALCNQYGSRLRRNHRCPPGMCSRFRRMRLSADLNVQSEQRSNRGGQSRRRDPPRDSNRKVQRRPEASGDFFGSPIAGASHPNFPLLRSRISTTSPRLEQGSAVNLNRYHTFDQPRGGDVASQTRPFDMTLTKTQERT